MAEPLGHLAVCELDSSGWVGPRDPNRLDARNRLRDETPLLKVDRLERVERPAGIDDRSAADVFAWAGCRSRGS